MLFCHRTGLARDLLAPSLGVPDTINSSQRECEPEATVCGPGFPLVRSSGTEGQVLLSLLRAHHTALFLWKS